MAVRLSWQSAHTWVYERNPKSKTFLKLYVFCYVGVSLAVGVLVQALISVQALVFDLAQLTCQKRFDCRNAILGSSAILLGASYS